MRGAQEAPARLELIRGLVNTRDVEDGVEELGDPAAATAWLREHGLRVDHELTPAEVRRVVNLREAIRELLLANNRDTPPPREALAVLNEEEAEAALVLRFEPDGPVAAADDRCTGVSAAIAELLAIVAGAMRDGTWLRLKVCPNDDCLWAFYDHSRNRSGTWCEMGVCGNRMKARSYRERQRASK